MSQTTQKQIDRNTLQARVKHSEELKAQEEARKLIASAKQHAKRRDAKDAGKFFAVRIHF